MKNFFQWSLLLIILCLLSGALQAQENLSEPVDEDKTLFRPGSISKLFTWTAVM